MKDNNDEEFVIPPGFFNNLSTHFESIFKRKTEIQTAETQIVNLCRSMAPVIQSECFKKGTSSAMDQLFFLKEIKKSVHEEEDLEYTKNDLFQALIQKSVLRSITKQGPVATTYHVHLPKKHAYFSKTNEELQVLIADISKETEPAGFSFQFMNRRKPYDLCISAVYLYDKVAESFV